jgi:O-methyltransferase involved in polyketide biosynthesis
MQELTASRTALATSLLRAAHTRLDPKPLIDDPWGDRLVPDTVRELLRARAVATISPSVPARYARADLDRGKSARFSHIALARVGLR